jgi:hypothetical protein
MTAATHDAPRFGFLREPPPNACRYAGPREATAPLPARGHVESYFLRANDPARPRALWLKATILAPLQGEPVAETWLIADGERQRPLPKLHPLPSRAGRRARRTHRRRRLAARS